jgi:probable F420-dependent oxidoreductase
MRLAGVGIWSTELRTHEDDGELREAAAELEELGYSALWIPGRQGGPVFDAAGALLRATREVTVATGILNIWMHDPEQAAAERAQLDDAYEGRFLLGLGVSHAPLVDRYEKPLAAMRGYLDSLDAAAPAVPKEERVLAALGPKMLELARERSAGAHPYLVSTEHTHRAREILGGGPLLAPELGVILENDERRARSIARGQLERYMQMPNYVNNWRRLGFGEEDFESGGSDRLVDALIAWGDVEAIAERIEEHFDAGADHVCLQVMRQPGAGGLPRDEWRELSAALPKSSRAAAER